jgi:ribosomal protein S18 acetylase RimI-like enzyme
MGRIVSLLDRERDPAVLALLSESRIHRGVPGTGDEAAAEYASNELHGLWGFEDEGEIVGLAGIEWSEEGRIRLIDLAVAGDRKRQGIGRTLVRHLRETLDPRAIAGMTREAAVAFFEATGFRVEAFGETAEGETRYRFLWAKR